MFKTIYPEYKWDIYKFLKVPKGYITYLLENSSEQKEFVDYLAKKFNITQTNDWYSITNKQLSQVITIDMTTVMKFVKSYYPDLDLKNFQLKNTRK